MKAILIFLLLRGLWACVSVRNEVFFVKMLLLLLVPLILFKIEDKDFVNDDKVFEDSTAKGAAFITVAMISLLLFVDLGDAAVV